MGIESFAAVFKSLCLRAVNQGMYLSMLVCKLKQKGERAQSRKGTPSLGIAKFACSKAAHSLIGWILFNGAGVINQLLGAGKAASTNRHRPPHTHCFTKLT